MYNKSSNREFYIDWIDWLWYSAPDLGAASGEQIEPVNSFNDILPIVGRPGAMHGDDTSFQEMLRMTIKDKVTRFLLGLHQCMIFDLESEEMDYIVCYKGIPVVIRVTMEPDTTMTLADKRMTAELAIAGGYFIAVSRLWELRDFLAC